MYSGRATQAYKNYWQKIGKIKDTEQTNIRLNRENTNKNQVYLSFMQMTLRIHDTPMFMHLLSFQQARCKAVFHG